jgi:PEP-CTERM motif
MKHYLILTKYALLATSLVALVTPTAMAANSFYAPGDLILYFQKEGGSNTIYANLGNTATEFRGAAAGADAPNKLNFLNLNSTLTSAFGAGWASDPTIYAGLAGVWGVSATQTNLQNGDPQRTLYISQGRTGVATVGAADSVGWDLSGGGNTAITAGAQGINNQNNAFENNYDVLVTVSPTSISLIDDNNPFSSPGLQGPSFGLFNGGNQQVGSSGTIGDFGDAGVAEFALDLYRILGRTGVSGQVPGDLRNGSFEGTVTVDGQGSVSFLTAPTTVVPEPSSVALLGIAAGSLVLRRRRQA